MVLKAGQWDNWLSTQRTKDERRETSWAGNGHMESNVCSDSFGPPAHLCQIKSTWRCLIKIIWDSGVFFHYHLPAMVAFGWENTVWGIWRRTSAVRVSPLGGFVPGLSPWKPLETDDGKSGTANCEDKELFETLYSACFGPRNRFHDMSHEFSRMIFA